MLWQVACATLVEVVSETWWLLSDVQAQRRNLDLIPGLNLKLPRQTNYNSTPSKHVSQNNLQYCSASKIVIIFTR
jgi:hypothetical protein